MREKERVGRYSREDVDRSTNGSNPQRLYVDRPGKHNHCPTWCLRTATCGLPCFSDVYRLQNPGQGRVSDGGEKADAVDNSISVVAPSNARGGSLLIVPGERTEWRESLVHPIAYAVTPRFSGLTGLTGQRPVWDNEFEEAIEMIGGLTAVDGTTVVTDRYELVAFGAKIARRDGQPRVEQVSVTEPIEGMTPTVMHPTGLGGTWHMSAAQFVKDQCDALALVASQDGRFTVFSWSDTSNMVHARRFESLLL